MLKNIVTVTLFTLLISCSDRPHYPSQPDLTSGDKVVDGGDYSDVELGHLVLDGADIRNTNFSGANLAGVSAGGGHFTSCTFDGANMRGFRNYGGSMDKSSFVRSYIVKGDFNSTGSNGSIFIEVIMDSTSWNAGSSFLNSNFDRAIMSNGVYTDCEFSGSTFIQANLSNSNLNHSNFQNVDFQGADMSDATLKEMNWAGANVVDCDLRGADIYVGGAIVGLSHTASLYNTLFDPYADSVLHANHPEKFLMPSDYEPLPVGSHVPYRQSVAPFEIFW